MRDVSKLPGWARHEIERLRSDVESWRSRAVAAASVDAAGTDTYIERIGEGAERVKTGLPPGTVVYFKLPDGEEVSVCVDRHGRGAYVNSPTGRVFVSPAASNAVYVSVES